MTDPTPEQIEAAAWFERNADRRRAGAFINTDPAYFASECADAIASGRLVVVPQGEVSQGDGLADDSCEGGAHCCCCGPGEPCCDCGKIMPGFTSGEVVHLNEWQRAGIVHEFTCGNDHDGDRTLFATVRGWICPCCDYTQDWAHGHMKDGSGLASQRQALSALSSTDQRAEERAAVVAWLRTAEFNTNTNYGGVLANRIERGDHLPSPPVGDDGDG